MDISYFEQKLYYFENELMRSTFFVLFLFSEKKISKAFFLNTTDFMMMIGTMKTNMQIKSKMLFMVLISD